MRALVIAETEGATLKPATLSAITAAGKLGAPIDLFLAVENDAALKAAQAIPGIATVKIAVAPSFAHGLPENIAPCLAEVAKGYTHLFAAATAFGKNLMPRAAALLDAQQISEIIGIEGPDTFTRPIYAGNAIATIKSSDAIKIITVRATAFDKAPAVGGSAASENITAPADTGLARFVKNELSTSERPELTAARIVVSGGRGMGSGENFALLEKLADKLGAAVGASRAAVDAGFVPNDYQVGQTGKVVAPELYIAVGISGAIQHLAGMKDSKVIVAINKDGEAPIFQVADYGLVGDLFTLIPELTKSL